MSQGTVLFWLVIAFFVVLAGIGFGGMYYEWTRQYETCVAAGNSHEFCEWDRRRYR